MKYIDGGITAPKGFKANGIHCGIRKNKDKLDLALIVSDIKATTASVYTKNEVKGAPIYITKENTKDGFAQAIICNSGNANTCNENGLEVAKAMCDLTAKGLNIDSLDVIVASTGVIGQKLDVSPIAKGMESLVEGLSVSNGKLAQKAIMTTDTIEKSVAVSFVIDNKVCVIGGIAKGSGMIHPNMATMLSFITTDVAISSDLLLKALKEDIIDTFNMVSVDQDTSTNDMVSILANGMAGNNLIDKIGKDFNTFKKALFLVTSSLSKLIAKDGEGATKIIECQVTGAKNKCTARDISKSVICSNLVKTAMFGADANWGRVLCAIGYAKYKTDVNKVDLSFISKAGQVNVCKGGFGLDFDEIKAKEILSQDEITIKVELNSGKSKATAYGCDLTYDYVKINGDYRT